MLIYLSIFSRYTESPLPSSEKIALLPSMEKIPSAFYGENRPPAPNSGGEKGRLIVYNLFYNYNIHQKTRFKML
ncbi:hypothetical protein [Geminocystis sp.]|uniref:hypothetical protein n=1 Tax=Geminocystis sp. TaxID=2664100 RepID=UPI003593FD54